MSGARGKLETLRGRLGSLEALQHAALGETGAAAQDWLNDLGLGQARRLGEALQVDAGWERAVETVLDGWLEAVLVDDPHALVDALGALGEADLTLIAAAGTSTDFDAGSLAARVDGPAAARALLARVHCVETLAEARARQRAARRRSR